MGMEQETHVWHRRSRRTDGGEHEDEDDSLFSVGQRKKLWRGIGDSWGIIDAAGSMCHSVCRTDKYFQALLLNSTNSTSTVDTCLKGAATINDSG